MKKLFTLFVFATAVIAVLSCTKENVPPLKTQFGVVITQQPIGGLNVPTVSATFTGEVLGKVIPVDVKVEWFVENATHENAFVIREEIIKFTGENYRVRSTAVQVLDPYRYSVFYWARFTWTDDEGKHTIDSDKAFCERKPE